MYLAVLWLVTWSRLTTVGAFGLEAQLYKDLLYAHNKIALPVQNASDVLTIKFGASLIRIIDIDEKNQILTTNVWLEMEWTDAKLVWDPAVYGNLKKLHIPSDLIWTPDIVLYNNAAGDYDITIHTDALVYHDGTVMWKPPAIYKSFCNIDVTWFPYDTQECRMKFGLWTYTGFYVDMMQIITDAAPVIRYDEQGSPGDFLENGMDLSYFYPSAEWDLLRLTSERHVVIYGTCCGPTPYIDITYYYRLRRKTLFYTVNLIVPCFLISFLTTFVFYLSDHKLTFAISILVTLTVFFLILIDNIPPTSTVIPMFGRYLMTTMVLVTLSTLISVVSVNCHYRSGSTHRMPWWIRRLFLDMLPRILFMKRPPPPNTSVEPPPPPNYTRSDSRIFNFNYSPRPSVGSAASANGSQVQRVDPPPPILFSLDDSPFLIRRRESREERQRRLHKQIILRILQHVRFIADHFRAQEEEEEVSNDWTYVAMVMDRLFLFIFSFLNLGTLVIILQSPTLYDSQKHLPRPEPTKPLGQDTLPNPANLFGSI